MAELKELNVGQVVRFKGYTDQVDDPLLTAGDTVRIRAINPDGGLVIDMLDEAGNARTDVTETDTLFPEEVEVIQPDEANQIDPAVEGREGVDEQPGDELPLVTEETEAKAPAKGKGAAKGAKATKAAAAKAAKEAGTKDAGKAIKPAAANTTEVPAEGTSDDTAEGTTGTDLAVIEHTGSMRSAMVRAALASVSEDEMAEADAALIAAKSLANRIDETYYTLGGVLAYVAESGVYKRLGYDGKRGFADYAKAELAIDYRKARYLISVFDQVQAAGINEQRLREIGWSKAIQIVRVGNVSPDKLAEDFDALVDYAKEHTRDELTSHIRSSYEVARRQTAGSNEKVAVSQFNFRLQSDAAASAERALQHAKSLAGTEDLSDAFKYICDDWSLMTEGTAVDLQTMLEVVAVRFGVTLTATAADGEIVGQAGENLTQGEHGPEGAEEAQVA